MSIYFSTMKSCDEQSITTSNTNNTCTSYASGNGNGNGNKHGNRNRHGNRHGNTTISTSCAAVKTSISVPTAILKDSSQQPQQPQQHQRHVGNSTGSKKRTAIENPYITKKKKNIPIPIPTATATATATTTMTARNCNTSIPNNGTIEYRDSNHNNNHPNNNYPNNNNHSNSHPNNNDPKQKIRNSGIPFCNNVERNIMKTNEFGRHDSSTSHRTSRTNSGGSSTAFICQTNPEMKKATTTTTPTTTPKTTMSSSSSSSLSRIGKVASVKNPYMKTNKTNSIHNSNSNSNSNSNKNSNSDSDIPKITEMTKTIESNAQRLLNVQNHNYDQDTVTVTVMNTQSQLNLNQEHQQFSTSTSTKIKTGMSTFMTCTDSGIDTTCNDYQLPQPQPQPQQVIYEPNITTQKQQQQYQQQKQQQLQGNVKCNNNAHYDTKLMEQHKTAPIIFTTNVATTSTTATAATATTTQLQGIGSKTLSPTKGGIPNSTSAVSSPNSYMPISQHASHVSYQTYPNGTSSIPNTNTNTNISTLKQSSRNDNSNQMSNQIGHINNGNNNNKGNDNDNNNNNNIYKNAITSTSSKCVTTSSHTTYHAHTSSTSTSAVSEIPPIVASTPLVASSSTSSATSSAAAITTSSSSSTIPLKKELPPLPPELKYDQQRLKQVEDGYRLQLIKNANMRSKLKNGWTLLQHQKAGIIRGLSMRRLVLAFDMGLGKTLIGCVWAKAFVETFDDLKVYIIAPVSLKAEWKRSATDIVGLRCEEEVKVKKGSKKKIDKKDHDVQIFSWAKVPPAIPKKVQHYVVICDEAHNMQSMDSTRTKDTLSLVLSSRCKGVLLLTGTPMKNGKPSNLFPLLKASGHPFGDDQRLYETFFCNGQQRKYGSRVVWDAGGSSNLDILNAHIVSHVFHKTKEDCLKGLPKKTREYKSVPVSSKYELQHNRALLEMANVQKSLDSLERDAGNEAILGSFSRLRLVAALAKIDATVAIAKEILQKESSLVIFTFFVQVAKEVHRKLDESGWRGELLSGETASKNRQALVDRFQAGISPVFISTFGAGGVGITLTAACTIILLDRPWTPGDALQAEDRVRRIGQTRPVKSIWLRAFQVDEQVDTLIEHKTSNSSAVVNRQSTNQVNQSKSAPKISIRKLVQSILAKNNTVKS